MHIDSRISLAFRSDVEYSICPSNAPKIDEFKEIAHFRIFSRLCELKSAFKMRSSAVKCTVVV